MKLDVAASLTVKFSLTTACLRAHALCDIFIKVSHNAKEHKRSTNDLTYFEKVLMWVRGQLHAGLDCRNQKRGCCQALSWPPQLTASCRHIMFLLCKLLFFFFPCPVKTNWLPLLFFTSHRVPMTEQWNPSGSGERLNNSCTINSSLLPSSALLQV